ncbi:hypothetical protein Sste5346_005066 [Sporothrix stenoceras]|uniref:Uncharacterized protein n=1 Tax=Sporothrix stenoceras TaxID=5173 RepID=A0ABR3Z5W0_9PEZI
MGKNGPNPTIRILLLGNAGVGKNCLESRFTTMTYPPPYNPALTLNSRRYFTLPPVHTLDCKDEPASPGGEGVKNENKNDDETPSLKKSAVVTTAERPPSNSSSSSNSAAVGSPVVEHPDNTSSFDDRTLVASSTTTASLCSACAHENNTYLVEVINYPDLQKANVRRRVHARADYDAVLLVYDVCDSSSFDAIPTLHAEIPVCTRKNHQQHHRRAAQHGGNNTRSRTTTTSGWFGGGGGAADGDVDGETTRTGSGEIVAGLVGNKCDVDDVPADRPAGEATEAMTGASKAGAHTEESLLHPLYRESILYEELMVKREERERQKAKVKAEAGNTPTTPFPGADTGAREGDALAPEQAEAARKKNDDIQKWLSISRPEPTLPMSPLSEPVSPQDDYFGLAGTVADVKRQAKETTPPRKRGVPTSDGTMLAQALQLSVPFLETSAQSGHNVELALENLVRAVLCEMGRDASGTNKAGKTCRHKERSLKGKGKEREKTAHTFMSLASPKLKQALSVTGVSAPPTPPIPILTPSVHDIAVQRPESAAMFRQGDGVEVVGGEAIASETVGSSQDNRGQVGSSPVKETPPALPTAPLPIQRRESVIGRMRKVFWRKSQTTEVHTGAVMPADIAV